MSDEMLDIKPCEVTFLSKLNQGEFSEIFHIRVRGKECVMKVYHTKEPSSAESKILVRNTFICESKAYRRLKEKGFCERGVVPQFFGCITRMDPRLWKPHLNRFLEDKLLPNAILIEHVPNMKMMDLSTFSHSRMQKLISILNEMHEAKIYHRDIYPRNMMVVPGSPDRILWVDFDRSQTYSEPLTERQEGWFKNETTVMNEFATLLTLRRERLKTRGFFITNESRDQIPDGHLAGHVVKGNYDYLIATYKQVEKTLSGNARAVDSMRSLYLNISAHGRELNAQEITRHKSRAYLRLGRIGN